MVKQIINEPGRTFQEYSLLTGLTKLGCEIPAISLETKLTDKLKLKTPTLSAAMSSVTGYDMALELSKEGGMGILPAALPIDRQEKIIRDIKTYEMNFVEDPVIANENDSVESVIELIERHGYSKIPVTDRNNLLLGVFDQQEYWNSEVSSDERVTQAMTPFKRESQDPIAYCNNPNISVDEAKAMIKEKDANYLVVLDEQDRLVKLAFEKDIETLQVGAAIRTHKGWEKRVEKCVAAGVDLIVVDSSDAYSEFASNVLDRYKDMKTGVPICVGNVITYNGALYLMKHGADIIKTGMSSGSICSTQREKATGRAPFTALLEANRAREDYLKEHNRLVRIISDGGISSPADMIIALTVADAIMMGGYFNHFYEAAGEKLDKDGKETKNENKMVEVVTYGEGSKRAQNLERYGHITRKTFFAEGEEGTVLYKGRLKPNFNVDMTKIKAALVNSGSMNLNEFRENAVIELNSPTTSQIVSNTHSMTVKK